MRTANLEFSQTNRALWPALTILRRGRQASSSALLKETSLWLNAINANQELAEKTDKLASPAPVREVTNWLHWVWTTLDEANEADLDSTRRSLAQSIARSGLDVGDQGALMTALDYLHRLVVASRVSQASEGTDSLDLPFTASAEVQEAYRRLAAFASVDLPVWICGEKGTELQWAATLIHRMRGHGIDSLHVLDARSDTESDREELFRDAHRLMRTLSGTIVLKAVDEAALSAQSEIYEFLMMAAAFKHGPGLIVTSRPTDIVGGSSRGLFADLFAYLAPMQVRIPPLRNRLQDIPGLIAFFAKELGVDDPNPRIAPDARTALQAHNWPGNWEELQTVVKFALQRRPAGRIRLDDLPYGMALAAHDGDEVTDALEAIRESEGFRVLGTSARRETMSGFLRSQKHRTFTAVEFQSEFKLGKETARRLLKALQHRGLVEGIAGPKGERITRYRVLEKSKSHRFSG